MAGKNTIGAKLVLDGEKEYRTAIQNINATQKELRSELKLVSSTYADNQESVEALTEKGKVLSKQYEAQAKKVSVYEKALDEARDKEDKAKDKVEDLRTALDVATKSLDEMKNSSNTSSDALADQQKVVDELKGRLALAEDAYSKTGRATSDWKTSLNNAQAELANMQNSIRDNNRKLQDAEKGTDDNREALDDYGKAVDDAAKKTSVFGDVLKAELATEVIRKGINELTQAVKASVDVGATFEKSLSDVAATMGMTADEIANGSKDYDTLKKAAADCGATTKYSASQAAEALNYLALAGYDANKSAEMLPKVLNLASAGGLDLATASDLATDAMAALGLGVEEADNFMNEMARTSQKSNTNVQQLGEATLVCSGTVKMAQQPLETMNAQLGILANNGIKGAEGGTHLRNIILSLTSPTNTAATAIKKLGLEVTDSSGNIRDMNDILSDLNEKTASMSASDKTNVISKIFNKTDISAVNALLKGTGEEFKTLKAELENCDGAAADMANTMEANLTGKITILQSALEGLGITAYDKIEGALKESVDSATDSVGALTRAMESGHLGESMDDLGDAIADTAKDLSEFAEDALPVAIDGLTWMLDHADLVAAGIGGITAATVTHGTVIPIIQGTMAAWQAYKTANEGATVAQWLLNGAMSANPAGILITAIAGLSSALLIYKGLTGDAKTAEQELAQATQKTVDALNAGAAKRTENRAAQVAELETISELKEELLDLNEKESLSNDEKVRMTMLVNELNQAMPELNLQINEQTGQLNMTNDELKDYINNMQEVLEIGFMEDDLTQIARDHYDAKKALNEVEEEYNHLQEEQQKIIDEWTQAVNEGDEAMRHYNETLGDRATDVIEEYGRKMEDLKPALEDAQNAERDLQTEYDNVAGKLKDVKEKTQEATDAAKDQQDTTVKYKDKLYEVTPQMIEKVDSLKDAYNEAHEEISEDINKQIGLFEKLSTKSKISSDEMMTNLKSQTDTFNTYKDDLLTASRLVQDGLMDEGLLGSIREMGVDGAGYLHELVTAAETDTETFKGIMDEWAQMQEAKGNLIDTLADLKSGYSEGMDDVLGIHEEKTKAFNKTTQDTLEDQTKLVKDTIEDEQKMIIDGVTDVADGMKVKSKEVRAASEFMASESVNGANEILQITEEGESKTFNATGEAIPQGVAGGIRANREAIRSALQDSIDYAIDNMDMSGITAKINRELGGAM